MEALLSDLKARFPYRSIYFDDDTFNLGNNHVLRMCEVYAQDPASVVRDVPCRHDQDGDLEDDAR
jgi:hypothetical protein